MNPASSTGGRTDGHILARTSAYEYVPPIAIEGPVTRTDRVCTGCSDHFRLASCRLYRQISAVCETTEVSGLSPCTIYTSQLCLTYKAFLLIYL